jgi:hypothetical protein
VSTASFVEQPQTLFSDHATPVRDRVWIECQHGTTWPADSFVTRPSFFDRQTLITITFRNHQRRFPACNCTLAAVEE